MEASLALALVRERPGNQPAGEQNLWTRSMESSFAVSSNQVPQLGQFTNIRLYRRSGTTHPIYPSATASAVQYWTRLEFKIHEACQSVDELNVAQLLTDFWSDQKFRLAWDGTVRNSVVTQSNSSLVNNNAYVGPQSGLLVSKKEMDDNAVACILSAPWPQKNRSLIYNSHIYRISQDDTLSPYVYGDDKEASDPNDSFLIIAGSLPFEDAESIRKELLESSHDKNLWRDSLPIEEYLSVILIQRMSQETLEVLCFVHESSQLVPLNNSIAASASWTWWSRTVWPRWVRALEAALLHWSASKVTDIFGITNEKLPPMRSAAMVAAVAELSSVLDDSMNRGFHM